MANRVRGVRQTVGNNTFVARVNSGGAGPVQQVSLNSIAVALLNAGISPVPGPGGTSPAGSTHAIQANGGGGAFEAVGPLTDGQLVVGQTGGAALAKTMSRDATLSASGAITIANNAVTYAKIQSETAATLLGNPTGGAAAPSEITLGTNLSFSGQILNATGGGGSFNSRGAWNSTSAYAPFDVVQYNPGNGIQAYVCWATVAAVGSANNFDPSFNADFTYTLSNQQAAAKITNAGWETADSVSDISGLVYFEADITTAHTSGGSVDSWIIGILNENFVTQTTQFTGQDAGNHSFGVALAGGGSNADMYYGGTQHAGFAGVHPAQGDRVAIAFDKANGRVWFRDITRDGGGTHWWGANNTGSDDPTVSSTGFAVATLAAGSHVRIAFSGYGPNGAIATKIYTKSADYTGAMPAGYSDASTGGSNGAPSATPANWVDGSVGSSGSGIPGGRLSLSSGVAVQTADVSGGTSVYYGPYIHGLTPIGTITSQLTLALDSNSGHTGYQQSGKNFDLFLYLDGSTKRLCSGPAWTNDTTRANAIDQTTDSIARWTNTASITLKFDTSSSTLTATAGTAFYVGTMRATANGQCTMQFAPAAGTAAIYRGLYNAYNRVFGPTVWADSTSTWVYAVSTWRAADNGNTPPCYWLDGLGQSNVLVQYKILINPNVSATDQGLIGVNFDSTSATPPPVHGFTTYLAFADTWVSSPPLLGLHYAQPMEWVSGSVTYLCTAGSNGASRIIVEY